MTVDDFYQSLAFPEKAKLGARIYKKQIVENAELTSVERKLLTDQVDTIDWRYTLKPSNCAIARYEDKEREYGEIALLHITLKSQVANAQLKKLGELLQRVIPYPLLVVFECSNCIGSEGSEGSKGSEKIAICMADKRINKSDTNKLTVVKAFDTMWILLDDLSDMEKAYIIDFSFNKCSQQNLMTVYGDLTRCIVALEIARRTQHYKRSTTDQTDQQRQELLQEIRRVEMQLSSKQVELKSEIQFNRQLEINVSMKQLRQELAAYTSQILASGVPKE